MFASSYLNPIQCDQSKPTCERCIKGGYSDECLYRDRFDIVLRDQTSQTAERAKVKWRSRSKQGIGGDDSGLETTVGSSSSRTSSFVDSVDDYVLQRFVYDWVIPRDLTGVQPGSQFMEFLPDMFQKSSPGSPLKLAVSALAYANYSRRCRSPESMPLAMTYCNKALSALNLTVSIASEAFSDETLTAITVLGLYEVSQTSVLKI
jgi:hypothetical protein